MASKIKRKRSYFLLTESSNSECSIPIYGRKKLKRITVKQSRLKEFCDHSTDKNDNSGSKFINKKDNSVVRTAIKDKNAKVKCRNKENTCHANVKPLIESKGKYNKRLINSMRKYNLDEDSCDSSASSDDDTSDRNNKVEVMGSTRKIDNGTSANKHDDSNCVVTSTPLLQNKQENKKNQEAVPNIRHRIIKMAEELKYMLSKFKLEIHHFQLSYLQDEIVTEQDGENITYIYNSIINKLKKELTVQQEISISPYHRCGETKAHSQSSSEIFSAIYKRPEVTIISKPNVKNNVPKQPLEANCTSAVTVEKSNNTTSKSDQSVISLLHRLKEINVIKTSSTTSVAGSVSTVRNVPDLEVLNRAYKKTIGRRDTTKQDSLRKRRVKEKGQLANYDSDVSSTCSTIALYPRKNLNVKINNYQGGLIHAGANKDVSSRDVSNRDVSNRDVSNRDVSNRDVSKSLISDASSVDGEVSDKISLTNLYSSDSEGILIISNNEIQNLKHRSKDHIPAKWKTHLSSSDSEDIRPKQRSEFVAPDINNLSTNYQSHSVAISNPTDSVPGSKPTEQNECNTHVDEKLHMNCQVVIEKFRISRYVKSEEGVETVSFHNI